MYNLKSEIGHAQQPWMENENNVDNRKIEFEGGNCRRIGNGYPYDLNRKTKLHFSRRLNEDKRVDIY